MTTPIYTSLVEILGKGWDDPAVRAVTDALGRPHEAERLEQLAFWEHPQRGVSLALKDNLYLASGGTKFTKDGPLTVVAAHLYSEGFDGYRLFQGELVAGLSFFDSRDAVLAKLGAPAKSGGGNEAAGKKWPYWDRFDFANHSLRVQYDEGRQTIDMLTIMAPDTGSV